MHNDKTRSIENPSEKEPFQSIFVIKKSQQLKGFLMNFLRSCKNAIIVFFFKVIKHFFQKNPQFYYGNYYGSHSSVVLFIKNLLTPRRYFEKTIYGRTFLPALKGKSGPNLMSKSYYKEFSENGILLLDSYRPDIADKLMAKYQQKLQIDPKNEYVRVYPEEHDEDLVSLVGDELLTSLFSAHLNRQPYLRMNTPIELTYPSIDDVDSRNFNPEIKLGAFWHFDTINMLQFHFILEDLSENDTCMIYALKSHRKNNATVCSEDRWFSEEYVTSNYEIKKCIGKKGTVIVFDPNGLHRLRPMRNSKRFLMHVNVTPGNGHLSDVDPSYKVRLSQKTWSNLSSNQKEFYSKAAIQI